MYSIGKVSNRPDFIMHWSKTVEWNLLTFLVQVNINLYDINTNLNKLFSLWTKCFVFYKLPVSPTLFLAFKKHSMLIEIFIHVKRCQRGFQGVHLPISEENKIMRKLGPPHYYQRRTHLQRISTPPPTPRSPFCLWMVPLIVWYSIKFTDRLQNFM